ncbi:hypothetical protein CANCADRAFT_109872 [Tortispora caseinolytica NRRL Y-17796]|uniref:RGS domain-containing protein n=1 Tax=Tortispora caseinolytica NRRL Y-17796 TaxID=767744 RepID=A0A1E4TG75_9ASCO|nr:hypothetical protein CANCADRAFT_109872 [Tortispora caseinolytica NRRL Y-17796]
MEKEVESLKDDILYRLPTLFEVLNRSTVSPVDLWSFYIFVRDQHGAIDYLDFWLDIAQHMSLCRQYVRELRRSIIYITGTEIDTSQDTSTGSNRFSIAGDSSKSSSLILEALVNTSVVSESDSRRLSALLRGDDPYTQRVVNRLSALVDNAHQPSIPKDQIEQLDAELRIMGFNSEEIERIHQAPKFSISRKDITDSCHKIYVTYVQPNAEKFINLPTYIAAGLHNAIEIDGRDDPEIFEQARDYVFQALELDPFPAFLQAKALGNLIPIGILLRLFGGLLVLFGAFWLGLVFIFLNWQPKAERCWVIILFAIGFYFCLAFVYHVDPILALCGYSESMWMRYTRIQEPFVRQLLISRSVWILILIGLLTAVFSLIFILVPGHRL